MIPLALVALATVLIAFALAESARYWKAREAERRAINRRVAYYGGRDAMDRPFLDG